MKYSPDCSGGEALKQRAELEFGIEADLVNEMMDRSLEGAEQVAGMFYN
jgi:hypothetical protein